MDCLSVLRRQRYSQAPAVFVSSNGLDMETSRKRNRHMNIVALARYAIVVLAASICINFSGPSRAQPAPTASHLAAAKELVDLVGAAREFEPLVTGVIIQAASNYLQGNPTFAKDLNEIAEQLVTEYLPRKAEM